MSDNMLFNVKEMYSMERALEARLEWAVDHEDGPKDEIEPMKNALMKLRSVMAEIDNQ